jgi:hypothetical protein
MRVMGQVKATVLLGFTLAAYNVDRVGAFGPSTGSERRRTQRRVSPTSGSPAQASPRHVDRSDGREPTRLTAARTEELPAVDHAGLVASRQQRTLPMRVDETA